MRIRSLLAAVVAIVPVLACAQFTWGGDSEGPSEPWKSFSLNPKTRIKLDFRNANVDMVLSLYSRSSGINIVKDPNLMGAITVTSAGPVSLNQAFEILNVTLTMKGFEMRKEGSLLVIRQRGGRDRSPGGGGSNPFGNTNLDEMRRALDGSRGELKVYRLQYANATQIARVVNEVFAMTSDPTIDLLQQILSGAGMIPGMQPSFGNLNVGGNQGGGRGVGTNQGGGRNNFNPFSPFNRGGGGQFGRGGFGGRQQSLVRASADDFSNSVIVNAPSREHQQVENLIKQIDKESEAPLQPKVYRLDYAYCEDVAPAIQNVLIANAPKGRGGVGQQNVPFEQRIQQAFRFGSSQTAFGQVVSDVRTNSLIVSATEENHKLVEQVLKELDTEIKLETSAFVVPLNNARADDLATLLGQAFGTRNTGQNRNNRQVGGRAPQTRTTDQNPMNRPNSQGGAPRGGGGTGRPGGLEASTEDPNALALELEDPEADVSELMTSVSIAQGLLSGLGGQARPTTAGSQGRDAQGRIVNTRDLTNQVTVIPDQNTNSLIVVTSPDNIDLIRQILAQLDRIPEQVMIETMIVEATLDAETKFGIEWQHVQDKPLGLDGTGTAATQFNLQNANPPLQGFRYTLTGGDLTGFINLFKKDDKFQVLSTPRIFTSNNAEAQINISQRVPYVLSTREDPNGNLTFTYAFQDVGIVLTVTPRITSNGFVTMDVLQTANDLQGFTDFNAPIINQRQADTTVTVKDGETIVLGGIMRSQITTSVKKLPLLGDIPVLGNLFKSTDKTKVKTELLVFLTPRVVRDPEEARRLREEQQGKLSKEAGDAVKKNLPTSPPPDQTKPPATGGGGTPPPTKGGGTNS